MTTAAALATLLPGLTIFLAYFARTAAFLHTSPYFSDPTVSRKIRVAAAIVFALAMCASRNGLPLSALVTVLPAELALGLALGFLARIPVAGFEAGGELIGIHLGFGFAASVDPRSQEEALPPKTLASAVCAFTFFSTNGPAEVIRALGAPLVGTGHPSGLLRMVIDQTGEVMVAAIRVAAPVLVATTLGNITFALASRAAPALNIFSVAFAGILFIGGVAFVVTMPHFLTEAQGAAQRIADLVTEAVLR